MLVANNKHSTIRKIVLFTHIYAYCPPLLLECRSNEQSAYLLFFEFFLVYFHGNNSFMVCAADNQIFYINIKGIGYIIKRFEVWLNRITTPFTYGTIGFPNLFCKPFSGFLLFCENYL